MEAQRTMTPTEEAEWVRDNLRWLTMTREQRIEYLKAHGWRAAQTYAPPPFSQRTTALNLGGLIAFLEWFGL